MTKRRLLRKSKTDPALERYPVAMAGLIALGEPAEKEVDYQAWAEQFQGQAVDLVRMALDEDLNSRQSGDPAVWAPIHALRILAIIGPVEAAEPLLECLDWEGDWFQEELPSVYGAIGPAATPLLQAYLEDSANDLWGRIRASNSLQAIAQAHPAAREEIVAYLTAFLDRPLADDSPDEEDVTTGVIADLGDLGAASAYEAIRRAYDEDRVNRQVIDLDDVERDFGMRPPLDFSRPPQLPQEPGVRLELKCKACGRNRKHVFERVYYDLNTALNKEKAAKYDPLVIPERVVCPKCGAVDQYELAGMGSIAVLASAMSVITPELEGILPENQRVTLIRFTTTQWGPMHPQEAIERYQRELARHPQDGFLHVGFGNVLRFLGRLDEAEAAYQQGLALAPQDPDVWVGMAQLAGQSGDIPKSIDLWQRVREMAAGPTVSPATRRSLTQMAEESLADLRQGVIPEFRAMVTESEPVAQPPSPPSPPPPVAAPPRTKVGRNAPCPCGSGKKYKHCHGRQR